MAQMVPVSMPEVQNTRSSAYPIVQLFGDEVVDNQIPEEAPGDSMPPLGQPVALKMLVYLSLDEPLYR